MNDPKTLAIDVADERAWLLEHKEERALSWTDLAPKVNVPAGTLSPFGGGTYTGDNLRIAEAVFRYRQLLLSQAELSLELPDAPAYFETPTSRRIFITLKMAQGTPARGGRMVMIAGRPGTSKTMSFEHYADALPNVWIATMKPTTKRVQTMQQRVAAVLGESTIGPPLALTLRIEKKLRKSGGLLIVDEAQNLEEDAFEEIRGWHDETGVGVCLAGNDDVINRVMTGAKKDAFARLASRMAYNMKILAPLDADALALADAWGVNNEEVRAQLVRLSKRDGGLRTCTRALELAVGLARLEGGEVNVAHLRDAASQLPQRASA